MGLLKFITESKESRRIFGEKELKIIEKQLLGVNLTQSEKNRLSRDIRKKMEFIEKAARFENEFRLKKGGEIKEIIKDAKEAINEDILANKIRQIKLFGSAVENKLTLRSDIDISVEFNETTASEATLFRKRLLGKVNKRVDLQVYNVLPDNIKKAIDEKGRILYGQDKRENS
ncbi:MAG: nucleotidyltransferase domain-containing protein [Candidatus Nanoarchaeia archaeon]|nr:nucleotidyltransferase domain-containing protein [Candidatus Nanoarchaeia archaeon]